MKWVITAHFRKSQEIHLALDALGVSSFTSRISKGKVRTTFELPSLSEGERDNIIALLKEQFQVSPA